MKHPYKVLKMSQFCNSYVTGDLYRDSIDVPLHIKCSSLLTDLQHGCRSGRSCETQLVTTFQDQAQMHNKKDSQIDIAV